MQERLRFRQFLPFLIIQLLGQLLGPLLALSLASCAARPNGGSVNLYDTGTCDGQVLGRFSLVSIPSQNQPGLVDLRIEVPEVFRQGLAVNIFLASSNLQSTPLAQARPLQAGTVLFEGAFPAQMLASYDAVVIIPFRGSSGNSLSDASRGDEIFCAIPGR